MQSYMMQTAFVNEPAKITVQRLHPADDPNNAVHMVLVPGFSVVASFECACALYARLGEHLANEAVRQAARARDEDLAIPEPPKHLPPVLTLLDGGAA